jgi:DNA-binding response OmpR family regulator
MSPIEHNGAHQLRVLVADDERDTVDTLAAIMRDEGHVVHGVFSGKAVLPAAAVFRPDVLICDIAIPGVSGYAVAQAIRHAFIESRRPLMIAISGMWTEGLDRIVAHQVGFDHHLPKPCDSGQLLELLAPLKSRGPLS